MMKVRSCYYANTYGMNIYRIFDIFTLFSQNFGTYIRNLNQGYVLYVTAVTTALLCMHCLTLSFLENNMANNRIVTKSEQIKTLKDSSKL